MESPILNQHSVNEKDILTESDALVSQKHDDPDTSETEGLWIL